MTRPFVAQRRPLVRNTPFCRHQKGTCRKAVSLVEDSSSRSEVGVQYQHLHCETTVEHFCLFIALLSAQIFFMEYIQGS